MALPGNMKGYPMGVAVGLTGSAEHTLRNYERLGLIHPGRTSGGIRSFSDVDIARALIIKHLTTKVHVNLVGIEVILSLLDQIGELKLKVDELGKLLERAPLHELEGK